MRPTKLLSQLVFCFRRKSEKRRRFSNCHHGGHPGFPIGTVLAIFDLPVTLMLPTKFRVNSPFGSWEEAENRFSRRRPCRSSSISYQVSIQLDFRFNRRTFSVFVKTLTFICLTYRLNEFINPTFLERVRLHSVRRKSNLIRECCTHWGKADVFINQHRMPL